METSSVVRAKKRPSRKGGFTLVEMVVALAVIAILSTMISTFMVSVSRYFQTLRSQNDLIQSLTSVQSDFEFYLSSVDREGVVLSIEEGKCLLAKAEEEEYRLTLENNRMAAALPDGKALGLDCPGVFLDSIAFSETNENGTLVSLKVRYELPISSDNSEQKTAAFAYLVRSATAENAGREVGT